MAVPRTSFAPGSSRCYRDLGTARVCSTMPTQSGTKPCRGNKCTGGRDPPLDGVGPGESLDNLQLMRLAAEAKADPADLPYHPVGHGFAEQLHGGIPRTGVKETYLLELVQDASQSHIHFRRR